MRRRNIRDQGIPRGSPDAFADAVNETRGHQPAHRWRQREYRLGECRQSIANDGKPFALAQPIRERAGKHLRDGGRCFGDAFDETDRDHRRTEYRNKVDRQEGVNDLGGSIHQQRDEAESPHRPRNLTEPGKTRACVIVPHGFSVPLPGQKTNRGRYPTIGDSRLRRPARNVARDENSMARKMASMSSNEEVWLTCRDAGPRKSA
jgi:hypothetical protein